jgi:Ca2+-binding RTX toxin-like protein
MTMAVLYVGGNKVVGSNGHLQIVHASGPTWAGSTLTEVEVQSPGLTTLGNWDYRTFGQPFGTSGQPFGYAALTLAAGQTVSHVWQLIGQIHASMRATGADLDYIALTQNNNSFIRTVLYVIGNDAAWNTQFGSVGLTSFPGWGRNVLTYAELGWSTSTGIALNLTGTAGNDIIRTGNGNDTLGGAAGRDTIIGGAGNDTINGGSDADIIRGGAGNDRLLGGTGLDTLHADTGRDSLIGGGDTDLIYGGTDSTADVFIFVAVSDSQVGAARDRLYNFTSGSDDIDLSVIDANTLLAGNQSFAWGGVTARAFGIWMTSSAGSAIVNGDVNGDRIADFQIQISSVTTVTSADFIA